MIADSRKESVNKADIDKRVDELNAEIAKLNGDNIAVKELKESVDKLLVATGENAAAIKAMNEIAKPINTGSKKSFREAIKDAILEKKDIVLSKKNDDNGERLSMKDYFTEKGHQNSPTFTVKVAVDMLESNIVQSNVAAVRLTELDPQRVGIPLTIYPHVMAWMPSKGITRPTMSVLVAYSYEDGAGTKTEGGAPSKSSLLFKTVEFKSFYIATYFTLSDETLDDLEEALDEISIVGPEKILDNIDGQILGTAGDDSTAIAGLFTANKHTDFDIATYTATVALPTIVDLIAKAKLQCEGNKYRPDAVIMHPNDIEKFSALKNELGDSVNERRVTFDAIGNPSFVKGLRILASTAIAPDTLAVVDSKQLIIGKRKDMTMEIGYNGTDLTEGQKTVVIKSRVAFAVRDKAAIIYCDSIAADVVLLKEV